MKDAFTVDMFAPCGLNCAVCKNALKKENTCPGCRGEEQYKGKYCRICKINFCERRADFADDFCDNCPLFPCEDVTEKETRYQTAYPRKESPLANLKDFRALGAEKFLEMQKARWTCDCGSVICVHTGICSLCGKEYAD